MTSDLSRFSLLPALVLDQGFVRLVATMGGDGSVVEAARVTTGRGRSQHKLGSIAEDGFCRGERAYCGTCAVCGDTETCTEGDRRLIRYMLRNAHWSPFEFAEMTLHLKLPMDVWRQLVRHWSLSVQEYSTRYSPAVDAIAATAPDAWRAQGKGNHQGSAGMVTDWPDGYRVQEGESDFPRVVRDEGDALCVLSSGESPPPTSGEYLTAREAQLHNLAREVYEERLAFGVAKEQARKDLPLSNYTEVYLKGNLRDWLNMLAQRLDEHAQWEIRQYAQAIADIVKVWAPLTWEAFTDYRLEARTFSRQEVAALKAMVTGWARRVQAEAEAAGVEGPTEVDHVDHALTSSGVTSDREKRAFLSALGIEVSDA